jgi:Sulfotransferase family
MHRFVVGTGRCGSTMLTRLLAQHPDVMVLSEFFAALDRHQMFSTEPISGERFGQFLDREHFIVPIIRRRNVNSVEMLGDGPDRARVPSMMVSALPMLSDDPLALYDEVLGAVAQFPVQTYAEHYDTLFIWLLRRTGKQLWVERSGPSDEWLPELIKMFPKGKYVHLHRDGPDTALSMAHNPHYQLVVSFFNEPPTRAELLATEYGGRAVTPQDLFSRRLSPDYLAPECYGQWWSYSVTLAFKALAELDKDQHIDVRYEDLITGPREVLERIADFFELPSASGWIDAAAALVRRQPRSRVDELPPEAQARLRAACRTGALLLGRIDDPWVTPTVKLIEELSYERFGVNA